mmetsp:Transcript_19351/g.49625  ORF Transcript_19351/g.49625 Transcript_19351/m.49625 type:complete len:433 (-) Transcript_19351:171-1469(-)
MRSNSSGQRFKLCGLTLLELAIIIVVVTAIVTGTALFLGSPKSIRFLNIHSLLSSIRDDVSSDHLTEEESATALSLGCHDGTQFKAGMVEWKGETMLCARNSVGLGLAMNVSLARSTFKVDGQGKQVFVNALFDSVKHGKGTCPKGAACLCGEDTTTACSIVGQDDRTGSAFLSDNMHAIASAVHNDNQLSKEEREAKNVGLAAKIEANELVPEVETEGGHGFEELGMRVELKGGKCNPTSNATQEDGLSVEEGRDWTTVLVFACTGDGPRVRFREIHLDNPAWGHACGVRGGSKQDFCRRCFILHVSEVCPREVVVGKDVQVRVDLDDGSLTVKEGHEIAFDVVYRDGTVSYPVVDKLMEDDLELSLSKVLGEGAVLNENESFEWEARMADAGMLRVLVSVPNAGMYALAVFMRGVRIAEFPLLVMAKSKA